RTTAVAGLVSSLDRGSGRRSARASPLHLSRRPGPPRFAAMGPRPSLADPGGVGRGGLGDPGACWPPGGPRPPPVPPPRGVWPPGRSVPLAVTVACGGAAVTIMLSGYASGGQLGLPLTGALAGATVASFLLAGKPELQGLLGPGVVGLFALLIAGHFFSDLTTP